MKKKMWLGSQTACELCHTPFTDIDWFADAYLRTLRTWAIVCPDCHEEHTGGRFGIGVGQKYDAKTKEKMEG